MNAPATASIVAPDVTSLDLIRTLIAFDTTSRDRTSR